LAIFVHVIAALQGSMKLVSIHVGSTEKNEAWGMAKQAVVLLAGDLIAVEITIIVLV
jgi:hypothetical protein